MSHPVNDEIPETLYEEVVSEWINDLSCFYEWLGRPLTEVGIASVICQCLLVVVEDSS